jgi:signal transduction histidine kinase
MELVVDLPTRTGPDATPLGWSRLVLVAGAAGAATAAVATVSLWPFWTLNPVTGVINLLVAVSFVVTAVVLAENPYHRSTARVLGLTAPFWLVSWWWVWPPEWQVGPAALVSNVTGYLWFVFGGIGLLRYPGSALARPFERWYFAAMATWIVGGKLLIAVVSEPEWGRYSSWSWWPTLLPLRAVHGALLAVFNAGIVVFAVVMMALLLARLRHSRGMDRLDSLPVTVAACAVAVCGGVYLTARLFALPPEVVSGLQTVMGAAAMATPMAFLMAVVRKRLARSAVADLVVRIAGTSSVGQVESELRRALQDGELRVWAWRPAEGRYLAADGSTTTSVPADEQRWAVTVRAGDGERLAVLLVDPALRRHPALVEAAVVAAGLALQVQAQIAEVEGSRLRIAETAVAERRRLERDLHDGAQQALLAIAASLSTARLHAQPYDEVTASIDRARDGLRTAITEVRQLARGLHPAVLADGGLRPALENVADGLALDVELDIGPDRFGDGVESTLYFVACEALTNAVKHAGADRARIEIRRDPDGVHLSVSDDGRGGAVIRAGSGLAGMRDRIRALGGELRVISDSGAGTRIEAVIPCG